MTLTRKQVEEWYLENVQGADEKSLRSLRSTFAHARRSCHRSRTLSLLLNGDVRPKDVRFILMSPRASQNKATSGDDLVKDMRIETLDYSEPRVRKKPTRKPSPTPVHSSPVVFDESNPAP